MKTKRNRRFYVSSIGNLFMISLENFADRIIDRNGKEIAAEDMTLDQEAIIEFQGVTTITRTSVVRIA